MHAMLWAYFPFWINITPIYFCLFVYFLCFLKPQKIILEEKKTGNKGEIMWKIGADFSVTGGEIWLGCNNPSESKTLEENKHRAQNSPCYTYGCNQCGLSWWDDFLEDWRKTAGTAADGWSKSTWPDWNRASKSVKEPSGNTLSHTERPFRERVRHLQPLWQQCFSFSSATIMFTVAIRGEGE